jgi:hypothetical protein
MDSNEISSDLTIHRSPGSSHPELNIETVETSPDRRAIIFGGDERPEMR